MPCCPRAVVPSTRGWHHAAGLGLLHGRAGVHLAPGVAGTSPFSGLIKPIEDTLRPEAESLSKSLASIASPWKRKHSIPGSLSQCVPWAPCSSPGTGQLRCRSGGNGPTLMPHVRPHSRCPSLRSAASCRLTHAQRQHGAPSPGGSPGATARDSARSCSRTAGEMLRCGPGNTTAPQD